MRDMHAQVLGIRGILFVGRGDRGRERLRLLLISFCN